MVFTLQTLIEKYVGINLRDSKKIFHEWFKSLLINLGHNKQNWLIKIIESFSVGGWLRIYTILVNLIATMMQEIDDFSFDNILDSIVDYSKSNDILKIGFECSEQQTIIISQAEIDSYESQYLLGNFH